MTIAERKAREEHDRVNPWHNMVPPPPVGLVVNLLFDDLAGHHSPEEMQYFRDEQNRWFQLQPAAEAPKNPMNWRPAWVILTPERRNVIRNRARL